MGLRKVREENRKFEYDHLKNTYNDSNIHNSSHEINMPTNFNLKSLSLEDIDAGVFKEFDKRFIIRDRQMPLISGDTELNAIPKQHYEQLDNETSFLNGPFFTYTRTQTKPLYKVNPTNKSVVYVVPKMKAQGLVYEEYISPAPIQYELNYTFTFISIFRETTNQMEAQMGAYFKNKRNIIIINNERFSIGPVDRNSFAKLDVVNNDKVSKRTLYVLTFELKMWAFTRDLNDMQKRERPNNFTLDMIVTDNVNEEKTSTIINIERTEITTENSPKHP